MQSLLFSRISGPVANSVPQPPEPGRAYRLLAANVQNPGPERVVRLLEWLTAEPFDVLVLSELQWKPGTDTLLSELRALGFQTTSVASGDSRSYHTVIASRLCFTDLPVATATLFGRVKVVRFTTGRSTLYLVGVYGPAYNEHNSGIRNYYKADFESRVLIRLSEAPAGVIIVGDLNVVEPRFHDHIADQVADDQLHYSRFADHGFVDLIRQAYPETPQYTWYSPRTLKGQRLDHLFTSIQALDWLSAVHVRHEFRQEKLSDHSALAATLTFPAT